MRSETSARQIAVTLGFLAGIHTRLGLMAEEEGDGEDNRDIDSARVYLEAADWKLRGVLERHRTIDPNPSKTESEED